MSNHSHQHGDMVTHLQTTVQSFTHTQSGRESSYSLLITVPGSGHNLIQSCAPWFAVWFWGGHLLHKLICYKVGELHIQSEVHIFYQQNHECGRVFLWIRVFSSCPLSPTVLWFALSFLGKYVIHFYIFIFQLWPNS